nr:ribonuclease H-like domain-containing protein [Tanacetum cinerariifolium]
MQKEKFIMKFLTRDFQSLTRSQNSITLIDMEQSVSTIEYSDLMEVLDGSKLFLKWTMFKETADDDLWKNQEEWILKSLNFYENCRVHTLTIEDGTEIYMLAERRYPLTKETLERMLVLRLIVESESEAVFDLLRFIQKQIDESGSHDGSEKDLAPCYCNKALAILEQTANGKETSNQFIAEGLHKGYDRFQTLLSQLEIHGAGVLHKDAKQKFLRSLPSSWFQVALIIRTKPGLDTLSFDDLYNNLRVFERDVKGTTTSLSNTQNVAFVSANNTSSTNDVSTAYSVSFPAVSKSQKEGSSSYTDEVIHSFFVNQSGAPQLDYDDLEDCRAKWNQDTRRRDAGYNANKTGDDDRRPAYQDDSKALVTIDGEDIDWSRHVEKDAQNYVMRAYSSSNSGSNNEVKYCSKACKESYARLKKLYDEQRDKLGDGSVEMTAYTLALKKEALTKKEDLKTKFEDWQNYSKNHSRLLNIQMSANDKFGLGYGDYRYGSILSYENEVLQSVFMNKGTKAHLADYQEFKGGSVAFGGSNGRITGKGKLKAGRLDFEVVYYVEELNHYNLFFMSQMCDKKKKVLFTDTDCLVLSLNFKLTDENQVLLKIPKQHNMYSFNLKNIDPSRDLACLFVKTSIDKSNKWHRRLGHVNFKNLNKQVKENLVRGLPSKIFENDHTCVACQKGKQHKASCKAKRGISDQASKQGTYELLIGRKPIISYLRPFGCHVIILITIDQLDKFDGKSDLGFLVGYSLSSKAFREELEKLKKHDNEANDATRKEATYENQNAHTNSTNLLNDVSPPISTGGPSRAFNDGEPSYLDDPSMPHLNDIYASPSKGIFTDSYYDNEAMLFRQEVKCTRILKLMLLSLKHWKMKVGLMLCKRNCCSSRFTRQEEGIDYDEVFIPVARIKAIRIFLAFASYMGFIVCEIDVKSAFLYGPINEEVYVTQTPSFADLKFPNKVYHVVKALYGLHQAPRACLKTVSTLIETQRPLVKDEEAANVVYAYSRFHVTPKNSHLQAMKRIFRYLKGQPKLGLWYPKVSSFDLESYSDSDYASANPDRKSTIGEAEYVPATHCCRQVLWIQNQLLDYGFNIINIKIYIDNESTICNVKNHVFHSKIKLIEIQHHFIKDAYEKKLIQVLKIHTDDNVADLLMKAFDVSMFKFLYQFDEKDGIGVTAGDLKILLLSILLLLKKVITTEDVIQQVLRLDDADGMDCLSSEEIFIELAYMGYEKPPPNAKRTAWNEFSCLMAFAVICLATEEEDEVKVPSAPTPTTTPSPEPISLPPQAQPAPSSPPQVLSFKGKENDNATINDVSAVEPTVFDDDEVTITMAQTLIKMKAKKARLLDEQMAQRLHDEEIKQAAAREKQEKDDFEKAKVLQKQYVDKQENINWNVVVEQMQESHLNNIRKYQSLKRKPISIAQAWKNMIVYLKNMVGYKMEHFKGMTYDKVRPIFERE